MIMRQSMVHRRAPPPSVRGRSLARMWTSVRVREAMIAMEALGMLPKERCNVESLDI